VGSKPALVESRAMVEGSAVVVLVKRSEYNRNLKTDIKDDSRERKCQSGVHLPGNLARRK
jgi:hypothetical protein